MIDEFDKILFHCDNYEQGFRERYDILLTKRMSAYEKSRVFCEIKLLYSIAVKQKEEWTNNIVVNESARNYTDRIRFADRKDRANPNCVSTMNQGCGLYMIGQVDFNPITKEVRYIIKIGSAENIKKRMQAYRTHNPSFYIIDTKKVPYSTLLEVEKKEQLKLEKYCSEKFRGTEWYFTSEKEYLRLCETGFKGL